MKRFVSSFLTLSLILSPILYGQDAKKDGGKDLPKSVQTILNDCKTKIISNRQDYDSKNMDVFSKVEKSLKLEQEKLTKAGDLDRAIMVKTELEGLREKITQEVDQMAKEGFKKDEKKEDGKKSLGSVEKMIVGKWKMPNGVVRWEFGDKGTGKHFIGNKDFNISWKADPNKKNIIVVSGVGPDREFELSTDKIKEIVKGEVFAELAK